MDGFTGARTVDWLASRPACCPPLWANGHRSVVTCWSLFVYLLSSSPTPACNAICSPGNQSLLTKAVTDCNRVCENIAIILISKKLVDFLKICSRWVTLTDSDLDFKTFDPGQRLLKDSFNINEESAIDKISNCLFSSVSSTIFHLFQAIFSFYSLIPPSHRLYPAENLQAPKKSGDLPEIRAGYRKPHSLLFRLRLGKIGTRPDHIFTWKLHGDGRLAYIMWFFFTNFHSVELNFVDPLLRGYFEDLWTFWTGELSYTSQIYGGGEKGQSEPRKN